jgi:RimJ/RimL family protein N-acetyltransferase
VAGERAALLMPARLPRSGSLIGSGVRLDPLVEADLPVLGEILLDPLLYLQGFVMHRQPESPADGALVARERYFSTTPLDGRGGGRRVYAVRLCDGTLVGTTSLLQADVTDEKIHIGATLYAREYWGSAVNPEAKLLLLTECFEACGYGRVWLQTDLLNTRSQAAIAKLGAVREGVARRDRRREDGTFRDTVSFSILAPEWPAVRDGLRARLSHG